MKKIFIYIAAFVLLLIIVCTLILGIHPDNNSSHNVLDVKKYEHIIQSCDTPTYWWQEWFFTDSLHHKYANEIYYMETYEDYFALLNEFYPIELPVNATDYDRYKASLIQFDSLMSFPGRSGATIQMYLYESYHHAFTEYTTDKIKDLLKKRQLYSSEVDSAWRNYYETMELVIDSVVMYRPKCLGTISGMEYVAFTGFLKDCYLNSMLEFLFYREMNAPKHMTITDEMICAAYDSLRAHQFEPDTEFDDIRECYVPVETRIDIINKDQIAWDNFIAARKSYEKELTGHMFLKHVYRRATNNLKWRKYWLLKHEYRHYRVGPDYIDDIFLPLECSDEDLLNYDLQKQCEGINIRLY